MSLDVYLKNPQQDRDVEAVEFLKANGFESSAARFEALIEDWPRSCLFDANITHNLNTMAEEAGIYRHLWRPDEIGITTASQLIEPLAAGLALMKSDPARFEKLNSKNGWGLYKNFVPWIEEYLNACREHPDALVSVSR